MAETEESPYVALRRANIERNEAKLRELGLLTPTQPKTRSNPKPVRVKDAESTKVLPVRRSRRLKLTGDAKETLSVAMVEEERVAKIQPKWSPATRRQENSSPQSVVPSLGENSARRISLDLESLLVALLGQPMAGTGKAIVMDTSARRFSPAIRIRDDAEHYRVSFNKYSGVQEWQRGIYLWVNLGVHNGSESHSNQFYEGGRKITWYGGSRMQADSKVIQRLIHVGSAAALGGASEDGIVLWCRQYLPEKRTFGPYHCLGRLAYFSHDPDTMPVSFVWTLVDYEHLVAKRNKVVASIMGLS